MLTAQFEVSLLYEEVKYSISETQMMKLNEILMNNSDDFWEWRENNQELTAEYIELNSYQRSKKRSKMDEKTGNYLILASLLHLQQALSLLELLERFEIRESMPSNTQAVKLGQIAHSLMYKGVLKYPFDNMFVN